MSSAGRKQALRCILSDAIIELCRREAFYITELRIEGTICVVSDRSSALIIQITEQVGEKTSDAENTDNRQTPQSVYTVADDVVPIDEMRDGQGMGDDLEKDDFASEEAQIHQMVIKAGLVERMEGKYNCPFCPKRYRFKHSLKDHINKHTGNRPHQCKHCSLRFIHLSSLCAHVRRRHSQVRVANFRCDICQDVFATEQFLKQHHTWKHKEGRTKASIRVPGKDQLDPSSGIPGSAPPGNNESIIRWSDLSASQDLQQLFWDNGLKSGGRGGMGGGTNIDGGGNNASGNNNNGQDEMDDPNLCFQPQIKLEPGGNSGANSGGSRTHHTLQKGIVGSGGTSSLSPTFHFQQQQQQQQHNFNRQSSAFGFPFGTSTPTSFGSFGFPPGHGSNTAWAGTMMSPTGGGSGGSSGGGGVGDGSFLRRSGNGKFQCPHCDKSYNFKHTLKEHINKHLGRRPNVCKHCGDSFIHLASLCAHIKRAHDEHMPTDFVCRICNEKLMNYQSLKQHYTWRHREARMLIEANAQTLAAAGLAPLGSNSSPGEMERNGSSGQLGSGSAAAAHLWQQQLVTPSQQPQQSQQQSAPPEHSTTPAPQQVVDSHGIQQQQQQLLHSNSKDEFTNTSSSSGTSNGGIVKNAALKELDFLQGFESFAQSIGVNMGLDSHHLHHHHHHLPSHHHQHGHHHHQQQPPQQPPPPHHHHSGQKDGLGPSMLLKDHQ